uniref:Uncharacterized protein n=1 Tax=Cacopsylla melanoneura TaxID=428564 RepID=A0A8D8YIZ6_9HEMI
MDFLPPILATLSTLTCACIKTLEMIHYCLIKINMRKRKKESGCRYDTGKNVTFAHQTCVFLTYVVVPIVFLIGSAHLVWLFVGGGGGWGLSPPRGLTLFLGLTLCTYNDILGSRHFRIVYVAHSQENLVFKPPQNFRLGPPMGECRVKVVVVVIRLFRYCDVLYARYVK